MALGGGFPKSGIIEVCLSGRPLHTPSGGKKSSLKPDGHSARQAASTSHTFSRVSGLQIFGPESTGKTSLALSAIAHAQKEGAICAFIDLEHALSQDFAQVDQSPIQHAAGWLQSVLSQHIARFLPACACNSSLALDNWKLA